MPFSGLLIFGAQCGWFKGISNFAKIFISLFWRIKIIDYARKYKGNVQLKHSKLFNRNSHLSNAIMIFATIKNSLHISFEAGKPSDTIFPLCRLQSQVMHNQNANYSLVYAKHIKKLATQKAKGSTTHSNLKCTCKMGSDISNPPAAKSLKLEFLYNC